jgi:hypothetical protein
MSPSNIETAHGWPPEPRLLFAAPYLWRCAGYMIGGALLIVAADIAYFQMGLVASPWGALPMAGLVVTAGFLWALGLFHETLWIDGEGIWRRRLIGWESWPWEQFATGQIEQGDSPDCFIDRSRPKKRQTLSLATLQPDDRAYLQELIRSVWQPTPPPAFPESMLVRQWDHGPRRMHFFFSEAGVQVEEQKNSSQRFHPWEKATMLKVVRKSHAHQGFEHLELSFSGDESIRLRMSNEGRPQWTGPDACTILRYLLAHVPPDRIKDFALTGAVQTPDEVDWRLARAQSREFHFRWYRWVVLLGSLILPLRFVCESGVRHGWQPFEWDITVWLPLAILTVTLGTIGGLLFAFFGQAWKECREERAALIKAREEMRGQLAYHPTK